MYLDVFTKQASRETFKSSVCSITTSIRNLFGNVYCLFPNFRLYVRGLLIFFKKSSFRHHWSDVMIGMITGGAVSFAVVIINFN